MTFSRIVSGACLALSSVFLLQLGGCAINDFLIRFAGAGGVVAGLRALILGA